MKILLGNRATVMRLKGVIGSKRFRDGGGNEL